MKLPVDLCHLAWPGEMSEKCPHLMATVTWAWGTREQQAKEKLGDNFF